jgi:hypothetical protein
LRFLGGKISKSTPVTIATVESQRLERTRRENTSERCPHGEALVHAMLWQKSPCWMPAAESPLPGIGVTMVQLEEHERGANE